MMEAQWAEPTWDVAWLFPEQGNWSEEEYFALPTNRLVEFSQGILEVLPLPTQAHQRTVAYLHTVLHTYARHNRPGTVLVAPMRVQLWPGKFREPDILFMLAKHEARRGEQFWQGADLVMEVVSPDDRLRDTETKRREYAQAGIPEYWIVDPTEQQITVLALVDGAYVAHGEFGPGDWAGSRLLEGFVVEVTAVFTAN